MKLVKISASPKQLSRLRNGHRVRVKPEMEGCGFNLLVDPSKYDTMTRSFAKGSAYQIQLTPDEVQANKDMAMSGEMEGEGIYAGGRLNIGKEFKKVGRTLNKAGKTAIKGIRTAEQAVRKNPTSRAIVKKALPIVADLAVQGLATYAGADPKTAKALGKVSSIGTSEGLKAGGYGLYAGSQGRALLGPPSRMPEKASIAIGGTLISRNGFMNPAMQSDAMGANFAMNTALPVSMQKVKFV